ncbi:MAG: IS3 family transposase [Pseudomonadota bacterium]
MSTEPLSGGSPEFRRGARTGGARRRSLFGSLKTVKLHCAQVRTRRTAEAAHFEDIAIFFNRQRRHSRIGYRTPELARIAMTRAKAAS